MKYVLKEDDQNNVKSEKEKHQKFLTKENKQILSKKVSAQEFKTVELDLSHFSSTNKNETLLLEMVKVLQKIEKNPHTEHQQTLEFKMTKPKQTFNFDKPLIIPEKLVMGASNLQVRNTVYNITERNNIIKQHIPSYYEQELGNLENFLTLSKQNTPDIYYNQK